MEWGNEVKNCCLVSFGHCKIFESHKLCIKCHVPNQIVTIQYSRTADRSAAWLGLYITPACEIPNVVGSNRRFSWLAMEYKL